MDGCLCVQEVAALTVVDTHVRERVCSIRQQEEDIATILSQVRQNVVTVYIDYILALQKWHGNLERAFHRNILAHCILSLKI